MLRAQENIIVTIAGKGGVMPGFSGDGGQATNAKLYAPESLCLDKSDNILIADAANNRIRKINSATGIITTIAGNSPPLGVGSYGGDNGPATNASLWAPCSVSIDTAGNVYIADALNNRIRKITTATGIITTIAGNGAMGGGGDGSVATNAALNEPVGLCLDKAGNIYIADYNNNVVRKVAAATGVITTFAGNGSVGYTGDHGPATNATFQGPIQVYANNAGDIFICDQYNNAVRKVAASTGIITTIAGNGMAGNTGDGSVATDAELNQPAGVYVDNDENIYIADFGNGTIRRIDGTTNIITTVAGDGTWGYSGNGGPATGAQMMPDNMVFDNAGSMIVADYGTNTIRKVFNPTLWLTSPTLSNAEIALYPNPAQDEVTITNDARNDLRIYDAVGKEVYHTFVISDKQQISTKALCNGVYVVIPSALSGKAKRLVVLRQ